MPDTKNILKTSHLFAQLDAAGLEQVASACATKTAKRGEMIFFEGDFAHAFYVVGTGKVKVYKDSPEGKEQILMIAGPGDSFAEAAMFAGRNFPASAQAMDATELAVIERERFIALMEKHPELAMNLIGRLSELLRKMTKLVEGLSLTDVTTRLAHYILESVHADVDTSQPFKLHLPEKKSVLAAQLGTIPETLSRSLAKLTKEGVIRTDGADIEVLDPDRLSQMARG